MDWNMILAAFWATFVLAMTYSFVVFKKNFKAGEVFDIVKMRRTIIISVVFGVISAIIVTVKGWTYEEVEQVLESSGTSAMIVVLIDQLIAYFTSSKDPEAKDKLKNELENDLDEAVKIGEKLQNGGNAPKASETPSSGPSVPASNPPSGGGVAPPGQP